MNAKDKKIMWLFLGIFIAFLMLAPIYVIAALIGNFDIQMTIFDLMDSIFMSFTFSTFITGILSYKYYRNNGIISIRSISIWFYRVSLLVSAGIIGILSIYVWMAQMGFYETDLFAGEEPAVMVLGLLFMFIGFTLAVWLALFFFTIFGFGIVSIISVISKGATPEILDEISKITDNTTIKVKRIDAKLYWKYYFLQWFFDIPYVLDTKNLTIEKYKLIKKTPWREIRLSVLSHLLFGFVIIIYISFNPFLLTNPNIDFTRLLNLSTSAVILVPFIILPWFIYYRLRVRIKVRIHSPLRSFNLYHGVKHRMTRILVALGTLMLFIRLGIQQTDIVELFANLFSFFIFFTVAVLIISFVYYNFFENQLVKDVYEIYNRKYRKRSDRVK